MVSFRINRQPIAEIIPDSPVPAIMLRVKVRGVDCKIVSNNLSQIRNGQNLVADRT